MTKVRFEEDHIVIIDEVDGVIDVLARTPENEEIANAYIESKKLRRSQTRKNSWFADALKNVKEN